MIINIKYQHIKFTIILFNQRAADDHSHFQLSIFLLH